MPPNTQNIGGFALPPTAQPVDPPDAISGADPARAMPPAYRERWIAMHRAQGEAMAKIEAEQTMAAHPQASAELLDYFIKQGLNPVTAAQLASRVSKLEEPPPPISNGIKMHPNDAVSNL